MIYTIQLVSSGHGLSWAVMGKRVNDNLGKKTCLDKMSPSVIVYIRFKSKNEREIHPL
jgi:hypothetical protein